MKNNAAYSHDEKITIIREHEENHKTLKHICDEYGVSKSYLCYLLKQYRESGKSGISKTRYYSAEYKLKVVNRHYEDGIPIADLTRETGIQYRMIKEWLERYAKDGYTGLTTRKRGRPKRIEAKSDAERIKQLEMENEVLRAFQEEYERWNAKK